MDKDLLVHLEIQDRPKKTKYKFVDIIREHKKEVIIGTVVLGLTIGAVIVLEKTGLEKVNFKELSKSNEVLPNIIVDNNKTLIEKTLLQNKIISTEATKLINVKLHPRNLPNGYTASPNKITSAIEKGVLLRENQTWVESYTKLSA